MKAEKKLLPKGISRAERTEFLNHAMRSVVPSICIERAKIVTKSYKRTEGMPYIMRRAHALADMLRNMTIFIDPEELIVGNHGSRARAALIYPEFGTFDKKELDLMPVRKVDTLQISEEDKEYLLKEIYPYWENRCTGDISRYYIDESIMKVLDSPYRVFNPLSRTRSGYGHYLPNIEKILQSGFRGIEQEAKEALINLDLLEQDLIEKRNFYQGVLIICDAVKEYQHRFEQLALDTWMNLNEDNKVSLYVSYISLKDGSSDTIIINKHDQEEEA